MKTAVDTDGQSLEMEIDVFPHSGGTPLHVHPHADESYRVLRGAFEVNVNGHWQTLSAGEQAIVPKGVPHTFRNTSGDLVTVYNTHRPAMQFEEYFVRLSRLANSGVITSQKMTLKAILHLSMLMVSYPDEIRSVKPPAALMRVFAGFGRMLGYRV